MIARTSQINRCFGVAAAIIVCLALVGTTFAGQILYVDADAIGVHNGSTWADAYNYLQDALAGADSGDQIHVAQGVYTPDSNSNSPNGSGDRQATFQLKNGVTITGGYAGFGESDPDVQDVELYQTILSGDLDGNDVGFANNAENSYHVVTGSGTNETAILDGFTITAGNANGSDSNACGAGLFNGPGSCPTLNNCIFSKNLAASHGGGMYNDNGCSPTLTNCTFSTNSVVGYGGGMYNNNDCSPTLTDCAFSANRANYGGAMRNNRSNPMLTNCTFSENSAGYAGGMDNSDFSSPTLINCVFSGNSAEEDAGAMLNSHSSPIVVNCTFRNNSSGDEGAGMYNYWENTNAVVTNCIFSNNVAEGDGGGMYNRNNSRVTLANCLFARNSSPRGNALSCESHSNGYPSTIKVTNCILWEGGNEISNQDDSVITITYSNVPGGWPGQGNIDLDPLLTADGHLRGDSPCINAGDPAYSPAPQETDIDGESRVHGGCVDMGPDEFIDSDGDGLPDWLEQKYFGSATAGDPEKDSDGDGLENLDEYHSSRNPVLPPRNYYVHPVEGSDEWDGLYALWDGTHGPKATIQGAIGTTLKYEGDTIILAAGAYTGIGNRDIDFKGKATTVRSTDPYDPAVVAATIINCQGNADTPHRGFYFHSGERADSAIIGLTISNGYHWGGGGAIYCRPRSSPTIMNNIVAGNTADGDGGGIYCRNSSPMIINNTIKANTADDDGGGIYCRDSSPAISNNIITENMAADNGGAIFCRNSSPTITNNVITGNRAEDGSGIWCRDSSPAITNNTITGNATDDTGGGIGCRGDLASPTITNSIIWGNTAANGCEIALIDESTLTVSYSDVQRRPSALYVEEYCTLNWAGGSINADPLFAQPGYWADTNDLNIIVEPNDPNAVWVDGDYHLKSEGWRWDTVGSLWDYDEVTSRCIDAGNTGSPLNNELLSIPYDLNNTRGENIRINMGAYGGTAEASMPPYDWTLLADLTNNGAVDFEDLAGQASDWLETESRQAGDLNRNGTVDISDLALLTEDWLRQTSWHEP